MDSMRFFAGSGIRVVHEPIRIVQNDMSAIMRMGVGGMSFRSSGGGEDIQMTPAIKLLYDSSREYICIVADNIARGMMNGDGEIVKILPVAEEPELSKKEIWNFQFGDPVKVKYSREDFKWIQRKTLLWNDKLHEIYGHVGFVCHIGSKYNNNIGVYFPEDFALYTIYAGALEKVDPPEYPDLHSRWKVGDFVKTIVSKNTVMQLQRGFDQIPDEFIGAKGRVIAVTHVSVMVTFDERKTYHVKSASLMPCEDKSPITMEETKHFRGFKIGEKVTVISNLKKLIENEKQYGRWNTAMCGMRGKIATVTDIQRDGSLMVQARHWRGWIMNSASVLRSGERDQEEEDFMFLPGDIVKFQMPSNTQAFLAMADVPMIFLEYLRSTAILEVIKDSKSYYVRFNADQTLQTAKSLLCKATASEKQEYESIKKKVKKLEIGDKVHLDIGPPNFVQVMIRELDLDPSVAMAMVNSATLIGFINLYTAVIQYENGKRFRVKRKYLTVPEKFQVEESKDAISRIVINRIHDAIKQSMQDIHENENSDAKDWTVNAKFMSRASPFCIEYKIDSSVATFPAIFNWLNQHSGWGVVFVGDGEFLLQNVDAADLEVKVRVIFNDKESMFDDENADVVHEVMTAPLEEKPSAKQKTVPFPTSGEPEQQRAVEAERPADEPSSSGGVGRSAAESSSRRGARKPAAGSSRRGTRSQAAASSSRADTRPEQPAEAPPLRRSTRRPLEDPHALGSVQQFKYMKLHDPSLPRNIYFPYVIGDVDHDAAQPATDDIEE